MTRCSPSPAPRKSWTPKKGILERSANFSPDSQAESFPLRWGQVEPDGERDMVMRVISEHQDRRFSC
jgi:hypothetical protein